MISIFIDGEIVANDDITMVIIAQNLHQFGNHHLTRLIRKLMPKIALKYVYQVAGKGNILRKYLGFSSWVGYTTSNKKESNATVKTTIKKIITERDVDIEIRNHSFENFIDSDNITQTIKSFDENHIESGTVIAVNGQIIFHLSEEFLSGVYVFYFDRPKTNITFFKPSHTKLGGDFKSIEMSVREIYMRIRN